MKNKNNDYFYDKYFKIFEEVLSFANEQIPKLTRKNVYHYTSDVGLKSILEKENLWLSDIAYLNDESEMKYFTDLVLDYINKNKKEEFYSILADIIKKQKLNNKPKIKKFNNNYIKNNYFIISFSVNKDCLPLWVNYTKNKYTVGYNIEFNKTKIANIFKKVKKYSCFSGKVLYDNKKQIIIIKNLLTYFKKIYNENTKEKDDKFIIFAFYNAIKLLSLFCKSPFFKNEEEYRIVLKTNLIKNSNKKYKTSLKFRIHNGIYIPYIEVDFKESKNCISGITISPTQKSELAKLGLEELLFELNYDNVSVNNSEIPLRY